MSNFYGATSLIGGGTGALDSIDGVALAEDDAAIVITDGNSYLYHLNATSAVAEDSPNVISPDANAGDKRWILLTDLLITDATGAELTELTGGGETSLHVHAGGNDPEGDVPVLVDSESHTLLKDHAYLAQTAGFVTAYYAGGYTSSLLFGYVGTTTDPAGTGVEIGRSKTSSGIPFISFFVGEGKYFEIKFASTVARITWTPFIVSGGAPIDQD